jgi:hypothetical protein
VGTSQSPDEFVNGEDQMIHHEVTKHTKKCEWTSIVAVAGKRRSTFARASYIFFRLPVFLRDLRGFVVNLLLYKARPE